MYVSSYSVGRVASANISGDTTFCEHRPLSSATQSAVIPSLTSEWTPGDDSFGDGELPSERSFKRRRSGEYAHNTLTSRLSRRWPSISKHWKDLAPTTSVSSPAVRSAPPTRASSVRVPSLRRSLATHLESTSSVTPPYTPTDSQPEENVLTRPMALSRLQGPQDIQIPEPPVDPVDREALSSTPLLPPMMAGHLGGATDGLQSPLQSPTIAEPSFASSARGTPNMTPVAGGMPTPPLSSRPSMASFHMSRSGLALHPSSDIPPMAISNEPDYWAVKLGHANFHIIPEPYLPRDCNPQSCKLLLDDWQIARREYELVAEHVSENYGPTSQTYKLSEDKWRQIDVQWQTLSELAHREAGVVAETTTLQQPADVQLLPKMPLLNDPPSKFPAIADSDVVGPMVQYAAKIQRRPSRRPAILKLFTDPASLLGGRSPFALRR